jgi:hypothetical protein
MELIHAAWNQNLAAVRTLLDDPLIDVNTHDIDNENCTSLHIAAEFGYTEIVQLLIEHPNILVNLKSTSGATPFLLACQCGRTSVVRILIRDPRIDVNLADFGDATPVWWTGYYNYVEVVKVLIASGRFFDLERRGKTSKGTVKHSIFEVTSHVTRARVESLLGRFIEDPVRTRHAVRWEIDMVEMAAAELFGLVVFICDDYLTLTKESSPERTFFLIATRLPMDLQMLLCNRVHGLTGSIIASKDCEIALRNIAAWE